MSWKMKKISTTKNRIMDEHKKDIFQKHKYQNQKPRTPMNRQQTHNAMTTQKKTALCISKMSKL